MSKTIRLLLLFSLLVSSCRPAVSPRVASLVAPTGTAIPARTPKRTAVPLSLKPCTVSGIKTECGYLRVPEDRSNPNSRILDLRIVVVRASGSDHQPDPLFFIQGGPGGVATEAVSTAHTSFRKINIWRDIVYLDQRGTNDKHHLTCQLPSVSIGDSTQQQVDDWMQQCLAHLDGDPRFYMTIPAMQDLDEARAALGYDKINLYGGSYGTKAVQVYALMFPEHVRAVVADHGNALGLPLYPTFPRAAQSALDQLFTYCEQDDSCHAAYPDIRGDWKAVLERLAKGPVVTSYQPTEVPRPISISLTDFEGGIYQLMYEGKYGEIPSIIHTLASSEDWTAFAKRFNERHPSSGGKAEPFLFMMRMIDCFEPAEAFGHVATDPLSTDSYYYEVFMSDAQEWQKICAALPKPDASLVYEPGEPLPVSMLMLNSFLDPIFPPSSMDLALREFTKSRVVVERTEGHYTSNSSCRWGIIAQFIELGSVDGLDISCLDKQKPVFEIGDYK